MADPQENHECPNCTKKQLKQNSKFCYNCGHILNGRCEHCSSSYTYGSKRCVNCYHILSLFFYITGDDEAIVLDGLEVHPKWRKILTDVEVINKLIEEAEKRKMEDGTLTDTNATDTQTDTITDTISDDEEEHALFEEDDEMDRRRTNVINEIFETEKNYVRDLTIIIEVCSSSTTNFSYSFLTLLFLFFPFFHRHTKRE
jgi:hypothetical protein